jgi:pSer/pThr/pTyr-binding forkhead associated (FHA) protein
LLIGRNPSRCDLYVHDKQVSRVHLFVKRDTSMGVVIADLKTTNGTRVAGKLLEPGIPTRWKLDEPVSIGETQVMLRYGQMPNGEYLLNEDETQEAQLAYAS